MLARTKKGINYNKNKVFFILIKNLHIIFFNIGFTKVKGLNKDYNL